MSAAQHVLLVEDDTWLATLQTETLIAADYKVTVAAHATAAIACVDQHVPDVIIVDMLLTGTTALALLHELQSHADTRLVPVILCTNLADSLQLEELAPYGVQRIVDKTTMQPDDIVAAVRSALL